MPGYDMNTTSGNSPNPSETGWWEFGTDKQPVRPYRINSDGTVQFGDGTVLDTTLARSAAGSLSINGTPIPSAATISTAVAVETARAQAAEALLLPLTGGSVSGLLTAAGGITTPAGKTDTVAGTLAVTGGVTVGTTRNFNETSRFYLAAGLGAFTDGALTGIAFDTASAGNNAPVTQAAGLFTMNTGGVWAVESTIRLVAGSTVATTTFELVLSTALGSSTVVYDDDAEHLPGVANQTAALRIGTTRRFNAADTLSVNGVVSASGAWSVNALSERTHVSFTYLGP
jgi:hypothetical protein